MTIERSLFLRSISNSDRETYLVRPEPTRYESPIREFLLPPEVEATLDKHQRRELLFLTRVVRRWGDLYALQESEDARFPFYPSGVTKKEILEASQTQPEILSPYTIVRLTDEGEFVAIPMHQFYKGIIEEKGVIRLIREAAGEAGKGKNRDFQLQAYLRALARSMETGNFKASTRIWLEREDEPIVDAVIGFNDIYGDEFLGRKFSPWASAGVLDRQLTHDAQWFLNSFLGWWSQETGRAAPKVKMRVEHTRIQSGLAARYEWSGNSLPCQPEWRREIGSKFIIFEPSFKDKFREKLDSFRNFINPSKVLGITDGFIRLVALRKHTAHETGHSLIPGENYQSRLQQHTAWIKELYCDLLALTGYRQVRGISPRESEVAMAITLVDGYLDYEDRRKRPEYHKASTILLNYCLEGGSIRVENGFFTWTDPQAVFRDIDSLLQIVEQFLRDGKIKGVQDLYNKYFEPTVYQHLITRGSFPKIEDTFLGPIPE